MKLTLKTLQGKQLPIDLDEEMTIDAVKIKIQEEHNLAAESQKLIAYGKVLEDSKCLKDYSLKEGDFLVVMVAKARPKPKEPAAPKEAASTGPAVTLTQPAGGAQPTATQPAASSQPSSQSAPVSLPPPTSVQASNPQPQPTTTTQTQPPAQAVDEETVGTLMAISGRPKELCQQALQVANGDPDVAFEFLSSGMPMAGGQPPQPGAAGAQGMQPVDDYYGEEEGSADPGSNPLAELAGNPAFNLVRQRMMEHPNFYNEFMETMRQQNPQVYDAIQANPMAFMSMVLGGGAGAGAAGAGAGARPGGAGHAHPGHPGGAHGGHGGAGGQGGPRSIPVTAEEMAAIQRLQTLGFSQQRAAEAFFACDKNEEFAANFLFEQAADDDESALAAGLAQSHPVAAATNPPAQAQNPPPVQPEQPVAAVDQPMAEEQPAAEQQEAAQPEAAAQQEPAAAEQQQEQQQQEAQPEQPASGDQDDNNNGGNPPADGGNEGSSFE